MPSNKIHSATAPLDEPRSEQREPSPHTRPPLTRHRLSGRRQVHLPIVAFRSAGIGPDPLLLPDIVRPDHDGLSKGGLTPWQLCQVRVHVERRLCGRILVRDLAAVTGLSPRHFCRAFKVSTSETPHAYVVRKRIRRAQRLMLTTSDPLSQIAYACGLTDQAHLTRLFRRFVYHTPMAWRLAATRGASQTSNEERGADEKVPSPRLADERSASVAPES
jgi:AraC family transcriptional regulator